jgi:hypothetical protein
MKMGLWTPGLVFEDWLTEMSRLRREWLGIWSGTVKYGGQIVIDPLGIVHVGIDSG